MLSPSSKVHPELELETDKDVEDTLKDIPVMGDATVPTPEPPADDTFKNCDEPPKNSPTEAFGDKQGKQGMCASIMDIFCGTPKQYSENDKSMPAVEQRLGVTPKNVKALRSAFRTLDTNNNGSISREELIVGMMNTTNSFSNDDDAVDAVMLADTDGACTLMEYYGPLIMIAAPRT